MTPERAAEVLRGNVWPDDEALEAIQMGAEALEFQAWLFAPDDWGSLNITICAAKWHGEDLFLDYCRVEWEKERKG
jgi:hypothetical protein